jgi:hypothetical protein
VFSESVRFIHGIYDECHKQPIARLIAGQVRYVEFKVEWVTVNAMYEGMAGEQIPRSKPAESDVPNLTIERERTGTFFDFHADPFCTDYILFGVIVVHADLTDHKKTG